MIKHEAEILLSSSSLNSEACHTSYDQLKAKHNDFALSAHSYLDCSDVKNIVENVDNLMRQLLENAAVDIEPSLTPPADLTSRGTKPVTVATPHYSHFKLDLPKFSRDMLDWKEFWSIFSARLDRESALSEHEKISCVETAMLDKGAKAIVRNRCAGGSYSNALRHYRNDMIETTCSTDSTVRRSSNEACHRDL